MSRTVKWPPEFDGAGEMMMTPDDQGRTSMSQTITLGLLPSRTTSAWFVRDGIDMPDPTFGPVNPTIANYLDRVRDFFARMRLDGDASLTNIETKTQGTTATIFVTYRNLELDESANQRVSVGG